MAATINESTVTITIDSDSEREGGEGRSSENILDNDENNTGDRDEVKTW